MLRWHIDYLLQQAQIEEIRLYQGMALEECSINNETARTLLGIFTVKGFGSSDCRCTSHLMLIPKTHSRKLKTMNWSIQPKGNPKTFSGNGYEPQAWEETPN